MEQIWEVLFIGSKSINMDIWFSLGDEIFTWVWYLFDANNGYILISG